ncbi:MAG TPA: ROK family protein [Synergistaceae bacterium]|nr:ROK family protein [Synergistaceae bacterium]
MRAIGIDLGGHNTKAALVVDGTIQERLEEATAPGRRQKEVCAQVARLAEALSPAGEVVPVGLGVPGMLDTFREHIKKMPNFPNWEGVPLKALLEERLSRPVAIENDANCYALGEGWTGAAKGLSSYVVITLGTGVGGGIVLDGKLLKGTHGMAGELGHIAIGKDEYCGCGGRGHLEAISGADALERLARSWGIPDDLSRLWRERRNPVIADFWNIALDAWGRALASIAHTLDPEAIVIGGGLSRGEGFLESLHPHVIPYLALPFREALDLRLSLLGNDAAIIGAAAVALGYFT